MCVEWVIFLHRSLQRTSAVCQCPHSGGTKRANKHIYRYFNANNRTVRPDEPVLLRQAVKLREKFIEVYKAGPLTMEKLKAANLAWNDVFEELPIRIQNGNLAR